jgi:DnaK suppressor protein
MSPVEQGGNAADEAAASEPQRQRRVLEMLETQLRAQVEAMRAGSAPVSLDEPIGRLSRMELMQQQQMAKANVAAAEQRLKLIALAYEALDRGEYGDCRRCEEPISPRRLRARPESPLCLRCQSARES